MFHFLKKKCARVLGLLSVACTAFYAFVAGGSALAQEGSTGATPTVSTMIDPSTLQSTIVSTLGGWVVIALGIALTVFVVFLGWKALRKGAKTGVSG